MSSLPPMRGMEMPGLGIEEMSSMPLSSNFPKQEYTVTSPPPSQKGETYHRVKSSEDEKVKSGGDKKESVSLKLKEGNDFKVALNMQQFSPDDITIKLKDQGRSFARSTSFPTM